MVLTAIDHKLRAIALGIGKGCAVRSFDRSSVDVRSSMLSIEGRGTLESASYS